MPAPYRQPPTFSSGTAVAKTYHQSRTAILVLGTYDLQPHCVMTFPLVRQYLVRNAVGKPATGLWHVI